MPKYLSSDNDPLHRSPRWQANLRILEVAEIKTVPYVPWSHPFVERLIGTLRRECLDRTLFWTTADLESKLLDFKAYFNHHRTHTARSGRPPEDAPPRPISEAPIVPMGISLPRPVSNTDSCLTSQLRFLTPSLDQQRSFADWTASSLRTPVNRVSQVSPRP